MIQLKLYILISSFLYILRVSFTSPNQVNAGLGSNTDIATTNIYNYMVEPIKTIDIKTEDDREKDREYYINSQE